MRKTSNVENDKMTLTKMTTIQNQAHSCQVALGEVEGAALGKLPKSANLRLRKQKIWQINGKICKNHEEKHEIDVKENEKSGEMRGFATPKQGMRDPKQGMRGQKQGIWALPKRTHPLWMHLAKPNQIHNLKSGWKQNLLPFLNSYYYQNCCRADSFQHLYIHNARKMV